MFSFDNKLRYGSILALVLLVISVDIVHAQTDKRQGVFIGDDVLILLKQDRTITDVVSHLESLELTQPRQFNLESERRFYKLRLPDSIIEQRNTRDSDKNIKQLLTAVRNLPGIEHAEPNYIFYGTLVDAVF